MDLKSDRLRVTFRSIMSSIRKSFEVAPDTDFRDTIMIYIYEGKINVINWDEEFYFMFRVNVSEGIEEANDFLLTFDPEKVILTSTEKDYRYGEPSPYGLVDNGAATKFLKYRFKLKDYVDSGKTKIVLSDYDGNVLASYDLESREHLMK